MITCDCRRYVQVGRSSAKEDCVLIASWMLSMLPPPDRYMNGSCTEGSNCKFAHGNAELHEWKERKKALEMKLNKARKDHLIAPNDNDFGKYSFLFKDLN